jgi:very-short-patch-repair endonuclease
LRTNRAGGASFRRQHAIGPYIADFCAPRRKLVIEQDGSQHLDEQEYDAERTAYLEAHGYKVLRFWNGDVMNNIEGVMGVILEELGNRREAPLP